MRQAGRPRSISPAPAAVNIYTWQVQCVMCGDGEVCLVKSREFDLLWGCDWPWKDAVVMSASGRLDSTINCSLLLPYILCAALTVTVERTAVLCKCTIILAIVWSRQEIEARPRVVVENMKSARNGKKRTPTSFCWEFTFTGVNLFLLYALNEMHWLFLLHVSYCLQRCWWLKAARLIVSNDCLGVLSWWCLLYTVPAIENSLQLLISQEWYAHLVLFCTSLRSHLDRFLCIFFIFRWLI